MMDAFEFMEQQEEAIRKMYEKADSVDEAVEGFKKGIRILTDVIPKYEHMHDDLKYRDDPHLVALRKEIVGAIRWLVKRLETEVVKHEQGVA